MAYDQNQINQLFQQYLGRPASQAEHSFLSPYVEKGFISPDQIGQYIQGTPEAQQSRLQQQQTGFGNVLAQNNGQILNQAAQAARGQFAGMGRPDSTGQANSVLQAGQQLAAQQTPMLANFYGQGQQGLNQAYQNQSQQALGRAYGLQDQYNQWAHESDMYNRQQNDYQTALNAANRRQKQGAWGSLIGAGLGAAGGGLAGGGIPGAQFGAGIGGKVGGLFGGY